MSVQVPSVASNAREPSAPKPEFPGGLTVLMAVWHRDDPALFEVAVESVFCGTVAPDDFVLVVDGPVAGRLEDTIGRLENLHPMTVLRLPENVGLARALNHGLRHVSTGWVARADADDLNLPDRFEKQAAAILRANGEIDVLGGAIVEVEGTGRPIAIREVPLGPNAIARRLLTRNPFNHMTVVYRTATVLAAGGYPEIHLKEDYALWATLISRGARCQNIADVLVRATAGRAMYRRRGGIRYVASEWSLQLHLFRVGHHGPARALLTALGRSVAFLLPEVLRAWMYEALLRRRPAPADLPQPPPSLSR
jgi:glycosyltransferase involved in cell wall biosynthesis